MPDLLTSEQFRALLPHGESVECSVTVRPGSVSVDSEDGLVYVNVDSFRDGVDVRVHDLQLIVKKQSIAITQWLPAHNGREAGRVVLWAGHMESNDA